MARKQAGFTILEILIVLMILFIITAMMVPLMRSALLRAEVGAMATEARVIQMAFKRFYIDNDMYPNSDDDPAFQLDTFQPLVGEGYYNGRISSKLEGDAADSYDSPDDEGLNQEFWLELTMKADPSIRFLIADSNDAPLAEGDDYNGIYMFKGGVLTPLTAPVDL